MSTTNADKFVLRPGSPTDAAALLAIEAACFPPAWRWKGKDLAAHFKCHEAGSRVAVLAGRVVGVLYVHRHRDRVRLVSMGVLPEFRRKGYGTLLVGDAADLLLKRGGPIDLTAAVLESNAGARAFLEAWGFRQTHTQAGYYETLGCSTAAVWYRYRPRHLVLPPLPGGA